MNVKSISRIQKANCNFQVAPAHAHEYKSNTNKQTSNYLLPKNQKLIRMREKILRVSQFMAILFNLMRAWIDVEFQIEKN